MSGLKATPTPWAAADHHHGAVYSGEVCVAQTGHAGRSIGEMTANAHLIAAAPDLYAALSAVYEASYDESPLIDQIRAALAKARGEAS